MDRADLADTQGKKINSRQAGLTASEAMLKPDVVVNYMELSFILHQYNVRGNSGSWITHTPF